MKYFGRKKKYMNGSYEIVGQSGKIRKKEVMSNGIENKAKLCASRWKSFL